MSPTTLVQIVPRVLPATGGVGGYAAALGQALSGRGITSRFLTGHPAGAESPLGSKSAGSAATAASAGALAGELAASPSGLVLLHYVNYGYHHRGCPSWLVDELLRWRTGAAGRRLLTFFHEVYASGPPWRSTFWVSALQRRLAARLLRASDATLTSLPLYARMLARWGPRREVVVAPVFSTVGEPAAVPALEKRRPRSLMVFGGTGNRRRVYGALRGRLSAACRDLDIAEIVDVGPVLPELPAHVGGVPVRAVGPRPEDEVSALMLRSYAGFLGYPPAFLGKSTVFAAYCAHGLVPVCAWPHRTRVVSGWGSGRGDGPPFWEPGVELPPPDAGALAAQARAWYCGHAMAHQVAGMQALLSELAADGRQEKAG
jgi:hypothetical protein